MDFELFKVRKNNLYYLMEMEELGFCNSTAETFNQTHNITDVLLRASHTKNYFGKIKFHRDKKGERAIGFSSFSINQKAKIHDLCLIKDYSSKIYLKVLLVATLSSVKRKLEENFDSIYLTINSTNNQILLEICQELGFEIISTGEKIKLILKL